MIYCSLDGWPRSCPKSRASSVSREREYYTFHYKNVHTEEEFELTLKSGRPRRMFGEPEKVVQARFKFS